MEPGSHSEIFVIHLLGMSIEEQLYLEESLLKKSDKNWCLLNYGVCPSIVVGISGKPEELLDLEAVEKEKIPVLRRFSGGGTVVVDESTFFVTLIGNVHEMSFEVFPDKLMKWTGKLWSSSFKNPPITLRDNDYVIGHQKCGGNAQYLTKTRWLHHTSFLWDYDVSRMSLLSLPKKQPSYRQGRSHLDFLTRLKPYYTIKDCEHYVVEALLLEFEKVHVVSSIPQIELEEFRTHRLDLSRHKEKSPA